MIKLLCLGLWILLHIGLADCILCSHCELQLPGKSCQKPRWSCRIRRGASCYKETLYYGTTPISFTKGCRWNCKSSPASMASTYITEEIICCANKNYCNR